VLRILEELECNVEAIHANSDAGQAIQTVRLRVSSTNLPYETFSGRIEELGREKDWLVLLPDGEFRHGGDTLSRHG
jgi:hypothetical protein